MGSNKRFEKKKWEVVALGGLFGGFVSIKGSFWLSESGIVVCYSTSSSSGASEGHFCF